MEIREFLCLHHNPALRQRLLPGSTLTACKSRFMFFLQTNLCFNIFLVSTGLLHDPGKKIFLLPCFAASGRHVQHLLCHLIHSCFPRQHPDSSSFQQPFLQSMIKSNKLGGKHLNASPDCNKADQKLWCGHDFHYT